MSGPDRSLTEDAVQYERVEVNIQLETAAEALDRCHRAGAAVLDAVQTRGARVEGEQRTDIHAQHRAAQGVIPGQAVAQEAQVCSGRLLEASRGPGRGPNPFFFFYMHGGTRKARAPMRSRWGPGGL